MDSTIREATAILNASTAAASLAHAIFTNSSRRSGSIAARYSATVTSKLRTMDAPAKIAFLLDRIAKAAPDLPGRCSSLELGHVRLLRLGCLHRVPHGNSRSCRP